VFSFKPLLVLSAIISDNRVVLRKKHLESFFSYFHALFFRVYNLVVEKNNSKFMKFLSYNDGTNDPDGFWCI